MSGTVPAERGARVAVAASVGLHLLLAAGLAFFAARDSPRSAAPSPVPIRIIDRHPTAAASPLSVHEPEPVLVPRAEPGPAMRRPTNPPVGRAGGRAAPVALSVPATGSGLVPAAGAGPAAAASGPASPGPGSPGPGAPAASPSSPPASPSRDIAAERREYALAVRSAIVAARTYPAPARRTRAEGRVVLRVRVDGHGRVAGATIEERSSHDLLDRAALAMARGIPSLPPPPGGPIDVEVPVVYSLRGPH